MYRGVFSVGVAVTEAMYRADGTSISDALISANALTDYSYINAREVDPIVVRLARCLTGLGPSGNDNGVLGGLYFNGTMILNSNGLPCSSDVIQEMLLLELPTNINVKCSPLV